MAELSKEQLRDLLNPNAEHPNDFWRQALELYEEENGQSNLKVTCKSCRRTIYNWLRK